MSALLIRRNTCRFKDFRQRWASRFKPAGVPGGGDSPATEFVLLNPDDGLWYEITDLELAAGDAIVDFGQTPVPAGTQPYRVIVNVTDGLKYKFALETDPDGNIDGGYDGTGPTLEDETPTVLIDASLREYELKFENDPSGNITFYLDEV